MTAALPISTSPQPARLTARDFWVLADAGAFTDFVKAELIEGELRVVNAVHSRHARVHAMLIAEIAAGLKASGSQLVLLATPSVNLSDTSVPEPDIALARRADEKVLSGPDMVLAIEISDTTLAEDLGRKMRLYAAHGVPEYWVADVQAGVLHQFLSPGTDGYAERREVALGTRVEAVTIAGLVVETAGA
jgi:Uma2 family endonuclease